MQAAVVIRAAALQRIRVVAKVGVTRIPREVWIWQSLSIDEQGKITDYRLTNSSDAAQGVVESIEAHVKKMEFMPGYYEGKAVPMIFVEPAYR